MANIISNQAYQAIQVPTEVTPEVQGTILYANQFSGIGQVGMPDDLAEVLNSNLGTIGNNVLVQLEAKMAAYGNGPWYVDSRDGVIYIHNRKFQQPPHHTYIFQAENGEVLRVSFTTQRSTKQKMMQVGNTIKPEDKQMQIQVSYLDDQQNEILHDPLQLDALSTVDVQSPGLFHRSTEVLKPNVDSKVEKWKEDRLKSLDEELASKKQVQRLKTESAKKEYDAKGTGYLDAGGGLESMSDTELRDATSQMLEEAYTKGELTNIKSSIDALVAGGMDLTSAMKQVYQGLNFVFKNKYTEVWTEVWEDPRSYSSGELKSSSRVNSMTELNAEKRKTQEGLAKMQEDPNIIVYPLTLHEESYYPQTYNPVQAGRGPGDNHGYYRSRVKVFKKVKQLLKVPAWKTLTNLYDRTGGVGNRERAMRINANGGLKITEKKLICQMQVVGRPSLKTSMVLQLLNVGKRWSGYWYIKKCTHRMDAGTGYITDLELVRNNGTAGFQVAAGNINTQDVVSNNARSQGTTDVGKNKAGDAHSSDFTINATKAEYEAFKALDGNTEEQRKFVQDMVIYREQNANTPTKGNDGIIGVERTVYQSTGKDGEDVVTITNVKRKKVEATKDVYRKYNFNIDYIIKQMNQDFSKTE